MTTFFKEKIEEKSYSRPSSPVVSMNLPKVSELSSEFIYNYYVVDERTNENPTIPDSLKKKSIEQDSDILDFSLRVPRYIKLTWEIPSGIIATGGSLLLNNTRTSIQSNLEKIQSEESFLQSRYSAHSISSHDVIQDANTEIMSLAGDVIDQYARIEDQKSLQRDGFSSALKRKNTSIIQDSVENTFINSLTGKPRFKRITKENKRFKVNLPNTLFNIENNSKLQLQGSKKSGFSSFAVIDKFNVNTLKKVAAKLRESKQQKKDVKSSLGNVEDLGTDHLNNTGITFYDKDNKQIAKTCGYEKILQVAEKNPLNLQINKITAVDVFASSSLKSQELKSINDNFLKTLNSSQQELDDVFSQPVYIGDVVQTPDSFNNTVGLIGYLIERAVLTKNGFTKDKTYTVENPLINNFIDSSVLYGKAYYYSVRTILRVISTGFDEETDEIREIAYYISSKPVTTIVKTHEYVPPPHPVDLSFIWDYKEKKLQLAWNMPVNSQRDVKQFQIFRRESIEHPFELISQKCFDQSTLKYTTGERVDGNIKEESSMFDQYIQYSNDPVLFHIDDEFVTNPESLVSSKYIYSIVSVDAHGLTSNYSAQFEVTFDFFKNTLVKKLVSSAGAPKPYPNLYLRIDAFKDVIKTSGMNSTKLKVYFMPEYFKIQYKDYKIQRMLSTKQDDSYYKIQFINLQNQKSDSLKITIDDPHELTK